MTRRSLWSMCAAVLALAACATKYDAVTPQLQASMMNDLQNGRMTLDCSEKCSFTWINQKPVIHQLDLGERWPELATRVMQIGYGDDLAYYYLGQSAQGLGYHRAAIAYYNQSYMLTMGQNAMARCAAARIPGAPDPCQGVDLTGSIPVLIKASQDVLDQQAAAQAAADAPVPAPVHHRHRKPAAASTAGKWVAPPPAAASGSSNADAGNAGWVAPPPAAQ